jgi:hypothetical protein
LDQTLGVLLQQLSAIDYTTLPALRYQRLRNLTTDLLY